MASARSYRIVDFKRDKDGVPGKVTAIEYDPNRSARLALITYADGDKRYILAPVGLEIGDMVMSGPDADIKPGNALPLDNTPTGTFVHNVELVPGKGGQLARAAGAQVQLMAKEGGYALLRLASGEQRRVPVACKATIGQVGNVEHENIVLGKAGRKRHKGWRPSVRGLAMNPVDHPHGGGEGKAPYWVTRPVTPWGKPTRRKDKEAQSVGYSSLNVGNNRFGRRGRLWADPRGKDPMFVRNCWPKSGSLTGRKRRGSSGLGREPQPSYLRCWGIQSQFTTGVSMYRCISPKML